MDGPPADSIADGGLRPGDLPPGGHYATIDLGFLAREYAWLWSQLGVKGAKAAEAERAAAIAVDNIDRYQEVSDHTGAPWYFVAAIHYRECSQSWNGCLHNGDPWDKKTVHFPPGLGPWGSWEEAAVDAIQREGYANLRDWRIGNVFRRLELFNGKGYRVGEVKYFTCHLHGHRPGTFNGVFHGSMQQTTPPNASPYVYSGTPYYEKGIAIEDFSFYPDAVDDNVGVMLFLKAVEERLGKPLFGTHEELFVNLAGDLDDEHLILDVLQHLGQSAGIPGAVIQRLFDFQRSDQPGQFPRFWACCNFSLPSREPRFCVLDRIGGTATQHLCAHGSRSESPRHDGMAIRFSNTPDSHQSSLGIYRCAETYIGKHGLSLRIDGLEPSDSNARQRDIVIHSAPYVSEAVARANGRIGCSSGCFALAKDDAPAIIQVLQQGSLLIAFD